MKKITSILLVLLLLTAVVATSVLATGEDASASVTSATGAPGEVAYVTISLQNFNPAKSIAVAITADDGLKLTNACAWKLSGIMSDVNTSQLRAVWTASEVTAINTEILTLAFTVPELEETREFHFSVSVSAVNGNMDAGSATASGTVTIVIPATDVTLDQNAMELDLAGTTTGQLTATAEPANTTQTVSWQSSDANVATVEKGLVTAKGKGEATITATIGNVSERCNVTVTCSHNYGEEYTKDEESHWYQCTACGEEKDKEDHSYVVSYAWAEDNSTCTATGTCKCGAEVTAVSNATSEVEKEATCCEAGNKICTVAFLDLTWGAQTQTKNVTIPATGNHTFGETVYVWEGYSSCVATRQGIDGCAAKETAIAAISAETFPPTCGLSGRTVYTATFEKDWAEEQTQTETLEATGEHTYQVAFAWDDAKENCTATGICEVCEDEVEETVAAAIVQTTAPTCIAKGENTHTATFTEIWIDEADRIQTETSEVAMLPHTWEQVGDAVWAEDGETIKCTAEAKCTGAGCTATKTATALVTSATTAPSCYQAGKTVYSANFAESWASADEHVVEIPATGEHTASADWKKDADNHWHTCTTTGCTQVLDQAAHSYTVTFSWNEALTQCAATGVCNTCAYEVTEVVAASSEQKMAPTCVAEGEITHTATFQSDWIENKTQTMTSSVAPTGEHTYVATREFVWNEEKTECTVTGTCHVCEGTVTATAEAVAEVTTEPTCCNAGIMTHTATFTESWIDEADRIQITESVVEATGEHEYQQNGNAVWSETEDNGFACTASAKCKGDGCESTATATATVTSETTAPSCYQAGKTVYTATFTESWASADEHVVEIPATGEHVYQPGEYIWEGYTACKVTGTCKTDGCEATKEAVATVTSEITKVNTCGEDGVKTYTATFAETWAAEQTKTETLLATGEHTWKQDGQAVWTQSGDTYTCIANGVCQVCGQTTTANATVTSAITKENDCGNDGVRTYTADFEESWATDESKEVTIPATGAHDYLPGDYIWDGYTACTVTGKCSVCEDETEAAATISSQIVKDPTCIDTGERIHVATFDEDWAISQSKTEVIPTVDHVGGEQWHHDETNHWHICATEGCDAITDKAAHSFTDAEYVWLENNTKCQATAKCECGREDTETVETTCVNTPANCYQAGSDVFTATFAKDWAEDQTKTVVISATGAHIADTQWSSDLEYHWHACTTEGCTEQLDKVAHTYKVAGDYTWNEDHSKCTVDGQCEICLQMITAEADVTSEVTVVPTCKDKGEMTYTATFVEAWAATQTATAEIEPTGDHVGDGQWITDSESHWQNCTTDGCEAKVELGAHIFQWKVDKAATEDETGLKHEECDCGYKRNENTVIPKLDHVHVQITHHAAVKATCVKEGVKEHWTCGSAKCAGKYYADSKCQNQLDTIVVPVDATNHGTLEIIGKLAPTCAEAGWTGDTYCTVCDKLIEEGEEIPATGEHTPADKLLSDETHHWKNCSQCEAVVDSTKNHHTFVWVVDRQPTEGATGLKHEECSTCKYTRNANTVIDKLQHAPYLVSAVEATCTEDGRIEHFYCGSCGGYYASENGKVGKQISHADTIVAATGHTYGEKWFSDGENHWRECECGEIGQVEKHTLETVGVVEATESKNGYSGDKVCSVCQYVAQTGEETEFSTVVHIKNEDGQVILAAPVADLVITDVSLAHNGEATAIPADAEEILLQSYDELTAEDVKLSQVAPVLVAAAQQHGMTAQNVDEMVLVDLFDVTILSEELEAYLAEEGNTIDLTFETEVAADAQVFVMIFKDGQWQMIEKVVNNGDGTITGTFEHFCPVAILTASAEEAEAQEVPAAADAQLAEEAGFPWWIVLVIIAAAAVVVVVIVLNKKRRAK